MAIPFLANIDLNGAEIQNAAIQNLTSAPSGDISVGQIYYDTSRDLLRVYDSGWKDVGVIYNLGVGAGGANTSTISLTGSDNSTDTVTISGTGTGIKITESGSQITIGLQDDVTIANDLTVTGDLIVRGSSTTVNSTTVTVKDPIIILGGGDDGAALSADDNLDKGIQFHWHNGTNAKLGFIGFDHDYGQNSGDGRFFVSADVSNSSEVITANSYGTLHTGRLTQDAGNNSFIIEPVSYVENNITKYYTYIYNDFESGGTGIKIYHNKVEVDSLQLTGSINASGSISGLGVNSLAADVNIYSNDTTTNGRGISFYDKYDSTAVRVARFFTAGDQNGKMNFNLNINDSVSGGTIWEIREGSTATTLLTLSDGGDFNFQAGDITTSGDITTTGQVSAGSYSGLPPANTGQAGIVELATEFETVTGTDATKAVTPDALAGTKAHATIDVSDTTFSASAPYKATITHNLGTEDVVVQLFDSSTKQTVHADVQRKDFAGTASTSKITVVFDALPTNDIEVIIYGGVAGKGGVVSYSA